MFKISMFINALKSQRSFWGHLRVLHTGNFTLHKIPLNHRHHFPPPQRYAILMCEKPVSLAIKSVTSVTACRKKSSTFPVTRHPNCMTPATTIRLQINDRQKIEGGERTAGGVKRLAWTESRSQSLWVERRRGRGGRKDAAEVKNIERAVKIKTRVVGGE